MKLTVTHETTYIYPTPQQRLIQSQRLTPSDFDGQRVIDWNVTTEGAFTGAEFRDGAGDLTFTVSLPGPVETVTVKTEGTVETFDMAGVLRGFREKVPPMAYTSPTRLTRADVALADLAADALEGMEQATQLDKAHALSAAITKAIVYQSGSTESMTTAAEALAQGKGVCQDQTHALISVAITQGLPARYITGYLFSSEETDTEPTSQAQGNVEDQPVRQLPTSEAGHAWAEIYIDTLGWVGFDPANSCCPDERYIRLCSGADAVDAAPIRGMTSGIGPEELHVAVAVHSVQQ